MPLSALRIEPAARDGLESVGLRTVGAIMSAPRAPLARRFGRELLIRLDQALGRLDEAVSPRLPVPPLSVERQLAEPISMTADIESLVAMLAATLKTDLDRRGEGARSLQLLLFRVDGAVSRIAVGTSRPLREPRLIQKLFHERLTALEGDIDAGYGFDLVRLSVLAAASLEARQADLAGETDDDDDLALFADRVRARLGEQAMLRPVLVESHIPERAMMALPFAEAPSRPGGRAAAAMPPRPSAWPRASDPPVPPSRACRRCGDRGAGRSAALFPLAACSVSGGAFGRARTHRAGMVARGGRHPDPRLFPCRRRGGTPLLALPAGPLWRRRRRAALVHAWAFRMNALAAAGYAEFGIQSNFSFLRGASKPEELAVAAGRLGLAAIGLADRNTVAGVVRAWQQAKVDKLAYHPGCRLVFSGRHARHAGLSAEPHGLGPSVPHPDHGQHARRKGRARSSSRRSSRIGRLPVAGRPAGSSGSPAEDELALLRRLKDRFGTALRLAVSPHYAGNDRYRIEQAAAMAAAASLPLMATNDVLYHAAEQRPLQDVVTAIRLNMPVAEAGFELASNAERHLKPPAEMARLFRRYPQALAETLRFAAKPRFLAAGAEAQLS